jgi:hypothetical protein
MTRSALGLAMVGFWAAVLMGAATVQWAPGVGDGHSEVCLSRPIPVGVGVDMNWHPEPEQSWWPLGVTCNWTNVATGEPAIEDGPGWGPTAVALVALAGIVSVRTVVRRSTSPAG